MINHWRLFDTINKTQLKQLESARIRVKISDPQQETIYDISGNRTIRTVVQQPYIFLSTTEETQETLLHLMFPSKIQLVAHGDIYR